MRGEQERFWGKLVRLWRRGGGFNDTSSSRLGSRRHDGTAKGVRTFVRERNYRAQVMYWGSKEDEGTDEGRGGEPTREE